MPRTGDAHERSVIPLSKGEIAMPVDHCQPIRDDIAALAAEILSLEELLLETPPFMKPRIIAIIKREKQHLAALKRALKACEKGR